MLGDGNGHGQVHVHGHGLERGGNAERNAKNSEPRKSLQREGTQRELKRKKKQSQ